MPNYSKNKNYMLACIHKSHLENLFFVHSTPSGSPYLWFGHNLWLCANKICIVHIRLTKSILFVNHLCFLCLFARYLYFAQGYIYKVLFILICIYVRNTLTKIPRKVCILSSILVRFLYLLQPLCTFVKLYKRAFPFHQ